MLYDLLLERRDRRTGDTGDVWRTPVQHCREHFVSQTREPPSITLIRRDIVATIADIKIANIQHHGMER